MPVMRIPHRHSGCPLWSGAADTIRDAAEAAVRAGVCLEFADFRGADLRGASLRGASLRGADFRGASLYHTDLRDADLRDADLRYTDLCSADFRDAVLRGASFSFADLCSADFRGARMNWQSRELASELLRRDADEDLDRRKVAGLVLVSRDWCWPDFESECAGDPLWDWALDTLAPWVRDGDNAPDVLRGRASRIRGEAGSASEPRVN